MELVIAFLLFLILLAIAPGIVECLFQIVWFVVKAAVVIGIALIGTFWLLAALG